MTYRWQCGSCSHHWDIEAESYEAAMRWAIRFHANVSPTCDSVVGFVPAPSAPAPDDKPDHDPVNAPLHYRSHPAGIEAITICEHYGFSLGNALKYIWRAGLKGDAIEDLEKASWYLRREIERRKKEQAK